ncbi:MAG: glycosyltransferase family 1 protein [Gordonia paraffinivorans]
MRVEFDHQIFSGQRHGGISRYFTEMIRAFDADPALGVRPELSFRFTTNEHLLELGRGDVRRPPLPERLSGARALSAMNSALPRRSHADLVHRTFYDPPRPTRGGVPAVCTVYDMIPELFPALFEGTRPHRAKRQVVLASDAVFCISETTRRDLVRFYGDLPMPVVVTHLAVSDRFAASARGRDPERSGGHVLYVGNRAGYKNFDTVLHAFAEARPGLGDIPLLCVGGGAFSPDERSTIERLGLQDSVTQRFVDDASLPGVYADALCFVFPSTYEGFGLPVVEAMAADCPVVIADTDCLVEVAGGAAVTFAPEDHRALADLLRRAREDTTWRATLRGLGSERAAEFTWHRTAARTAEVYHRLSTSAG